MSYYSNYEGYKPLYYESDSDDVPMISRERYAPPGCYHDNRSQPYLLGSWNEEPSVTKEMEQPKMSNLERLLQEAIEQTERQSRELDEIFDWNSEPNNQRPYDTFTIANEHVDDVEYDYYYSNDHAPYSSNFVFQDDSEEEMNEEEENYEFTNYPQETSQVVLQESHALEPELTEDSDLEEANNEEELLEIMEERLEEEPVIEKSLDDDLLNLLGRDDAELEKLSHKHGMMTEDELLELMGLKMDGPHPLDEKIVGLREDDMLCIKNSLEASLTDSKPEILPCEHEFVIVKEPKPPDSFLTTYIDYSLEGDPGDIEKVISFSLVVACGGFLRKYCGNIRLINKPRENKWRVGVYITTLGWVMCYENNITIDNILQNEYDWKGIGVVILDPP